MIREYSVDAGVVISASHNPAEFNGIKIFNSSGYKLPDNIEERIEKIILNNSETLPILSGDGVGNVTDKPDAKEDYVSFLMKTVDTTFGGLKIALDCANGAAYETAPRIFRDLGAEVLVINNKPDGLNINKNCGSTHMEMLSEYVVNNKCHIGLAFDGDADRVLAVDERGRTIDGDIIMAIIGLELKSRNRLANNTIVTTVMSNIGFDIMAKENDIVLENQSRGPICTGTDA